MSKADGQKIVIKFDQPLGGDVSGRTPPVGGTVLRKIERYLPSVSNEYSFTYQGTEALDSNPSSSYWRSDAAAPQWLMLQTFDVFVMTRFRYYVGNTSYRAGDFKIQGSNDGTTWTDLMSDTIVGRAVGWYEFDFLNDTPYVYYRFYMTTKPQTTVRHYEMEFWANDAVGNERAFTVTWPQRMHMNGGPLVPSNGAVAAVSAHPTEPNAILLTMVEMERRIDFVRFGEADGDITVSYDAQLGNLRGEGMVYVASFTASFTPTDLEGNQNPWITEYITAAIQPTFTVTRIYYTNAYAEENITATVLPTFTVTKVGSNPL